eukprot:augustus_masked-scaffold_13-processed-gene-2.10-mRNA-1 protein AED:0.19 eAED:0.19 QI:0/-1/0/1/-1/1/1/0/175
MSFGGTCVKDVAPTQFINLYADHLKRQGKIELPPWVDLVKTAPFKELPPASADWYFVRAAAIARRLYMSPGAGVGRLSKAFGGKANRGSRKERWQKGSRGLIRHILQQLEEINVIEKTEKGGRKLTPTGQQDLDRIAGNLKEKMEEEEEDQESETESEEETEESEEESEEDEDSD